ncbi:MAG TPA: YidC/Oxa1 family membrane protein insertase [Verrucomicrobiae bacterium]|nr:YidC/Oxa1 family membrane protein insertase [Verrucomicrobiae bacterium]
MHVLLASWISPIVDGLATVISWIHIVVPNLGLCLIVLAVLIRIVFWPLNNAQFKAMIAMQKLAPKTKALQAKYKDDKPKLQEETMKLYKESGANPLAGCWPMLVQYPFIISVYYVVTAHKDLYAKTHFLWIGSGLSAHLPAKFQWILGASLAQPDLILVVLYAISLYISMRYTTMPPTDEQSAQTMKMMQMISPLMFGFFAIRASWPSAMVLYWFSFNVLTMGQQLYLLRSHHMKLAAADSEHTINQDADVALTTGPAPVERFAIAGGSGSSNGSRKKRKKGSKR